MTTGLDGVAGEGDSALESCDRFFPPTSLFSDVVDGFRSDFDLTSSFSCLISDEMGDEPYLYALGTIIMNTVSGALSGGCRWPSIRPKTRDDLYPNIRKNCLCSTCLAEASLPLASRRSSLKSNKGGCSEMGSRYVRVMLRVKERARGMLGR